MLHIANDNKNCPLQYTDNFIKMAVSNQLPRQFYRNIPEAIASEGMQGRIITLVEPLCLKELHSINP
jgi:hypothetical protein